MSISKYTTSKGDFYNVNAYLGVDDATGQKVYARKKGFKTKKEAQQYARTAMLQYAQGGQLDQPSNMTFSQLYHEWLGIYSQDVQPSTLAHTKRSIEIHILPHLGQLRISKIKSNTLQKLVNEWHKTYKENRKIIGNLKRIFLYAYKMKYIHENPCDYIFTPKKKRDYKPTKTSIDYLTKDQLKHFLSCCEEMQTARWWAFFRLLAFTGIRRGEALALTWSDIDNKNGLLTINKSLSSNGQEHYLSKGKTDKSQRVISIDAITLKVLKHWKVEQAQTLIGLGHNAMGKGQLIFSRYKDNGFMCLATPYNVLNKICKKHNLPTMRIHTFRHTHCSLLFEAGVPMKDVKERLGHSDIQTTMNIYTHVTPQSRDLSAEKFAKYANF